VRVGIVDYGMGNIFSLQNALQEIGVESTLLTEPKFVVDAPHVIIPGVGGAEVAMARLHSSGLGGALVERAKLKKPTTGICLGMQLFSSNSAETSGGEVPCLDLISGRVKNIKSFVTKQDARVPSVGWYETNFDLKSTPDNMRWIEEFQGSRFYYVHSYQFITSNQKHTVAHYEYYGSSITSMVASGYNVAVQFHPEKSGKIGLEFLSKLIRNPR